ncbi:MAG: hypothetical protein Q8K75_09305 [Chlamydiales bacterium]|nr:hypothetical protein [Chlamydiales bacterium]
MITFEKCIYNNLTPLFFPAEVKNESQEFSESFLEEFKKNYIKETSKAFAFKTAFYLSGGAVMFCSYTQGLTSSLTIISVVGTGALGLNWSRWTTKPYQLALSAYRAMSERDEQAALHFIKQGANIYQDFSHLSIKTGINYDLFSQATEFDCKEVVKCLISLGWVLKKDASLLGQATSIEMAQLLMALGADVNLYDGKKYSPLSIQLSRFPKGASDQTCLLGKFENRCSVILFLIERGAKLQSNLPRFDEKKRAQNMLPGILDGVYQLDEESQQKIMADIQTIYGEILGSNQANDIFADIHDDVQKVKEAFEYFRAPPHPRQPK